MHKNQVYCLHLDLKLNNYEKNKYLETLKFHLNITKQFFEVLCDIKILFKLFYLFFGKWRFI